MRLIILIRTTDVAKIVARDLCQNFKILLCAIMNKNMYFPRRKNTVCINTDVLIEYMTNL